MNAYLKKNKIALFMLPPLTQGGGAEKYFIELAGNLRRRGIEADIVTMDEIFFRKFARLLHIFARGNFFGRIGMAGREKKEDINQHLGEARWIRTNFKNLKNILKNYDIIYSKNELVDLFLLKLVGYRKLPPVIIGMHTPLCYPETKSFISKLHNFIYSSFAYKWFLQGAKCVHVSNKYTKEFIDKNFKIKSKFIYYSFSEKTVFELAQKNQSIIRFNKDEKNIVFIGRIGEQKGIDIMIKLIEDISRKKALVKKIRINIFGSGDKQYQKKVEELSKKHPFVDYFGHIENKFIPDILSRQDIMLAPSRWETLPYSVLEAQVMGVPVIAFDIPGPSDIIINGKTGFLTRSEKEFFEKMEDIVEGKVKFNKEIITQNIRKRFDPEKIYPEMINMFKQIACQN